MPLKELVSIIKDAAAGLREVALVVLLAVLLFNPPVLVGWLESSQLEKVGVFGISFEARKAAQESRQLSLQAANQAQDVEGQAKAAEAKLAQLTTTLKRVIPSTAQPSLAAPRAASPAELRELVKQVESVRRDLASTRTSARLAQAGARQAVIAQTRAVEKAGGIVRREGWVWVGQIDATSGKLRDVGEPETVQAPRTLDPARLKNDEVRFVATTDVYAEPFDGASQRSLIVGVVAAGKTATVTAARLVRFRREGVPGRDANDQILWVRIDPD